MADPNPSTLLLVLDLSGIFVFATSGALVAVRKQLDVFGVLVLAGTTGLGGGFLRDVLIDATPPAALEDWRYLVVPVASGGLAFFYHPVLGRVERTVNVNGSSSPRTSMISSRVASGRFPPSYS